MVRYAREVIAAEVSGKAAPPSPDFGPPHPVFVTIEKNNRVLGCRGTLETHKASLADEIGSAARSACAHDPRYRPLRQNGLEGFLVTVTVVDRLESLDSVQNLQPSDGLVLSAGSKQGIVLPWEGKDPAIRLKWAYQKAGVPVGSGARLLRMTAERWRG